jgi:hypothetical protein
MKPFRYIPELNSFIVEPAFAALVARVGLAEWSSVVFLGRLFARDNDFGEHWFDNWDEREVLKPQAEALGIDPEQLMIVIPERFADGKDGVSRQQNWADLKADGPCNSPALRKMFWTEVLKSLDLSYEFIFDAAIENAKKESVFNDDNDFNIYQVQSEIEKIKEEMK